MVRGYSALRGPGGADGRRVHLGMGRSSSSPTRSRSTRCTPSWRGASRSQRSRSCSFYPSCASRARSIEPEDGADSRRVAGRQATSSRPGAWMGRRGRRRHEQRSSPGSTWSSRRCSRRLLLRRRPRKSTLLGVAHRRWPGCGSSRESVLSRRLGLRRHARRHVCGRVLGAHHRSRVDQRTPRRQCADARAARYGRAWSAAGYPCVREQAALPTDPSVIVAIVITGVFASAVAFVVQTWAQRKLSRLARRRSSSSPSRRLVACSGGRRGYLAVREVFGSVAHVLGHGRVGSGCGDGAGGGQRWCSSRRWRACPRRCIDDWSPQVEGGCRLEQP